MSSASQVVKRPLLRGDKTLVKVLILTAAMPALSVTPVNTQLFLQSRTDSKEEIR